MSETLRQRIRERGENAEFRRLRDRETIKAFKSEFNWKAPLCLAVVMTGAYFAAAYQENIIESFSYCVDKLDSMFDPIRNWFGIRKY